MIGRQLMKAAHSNGGLKVGGLETLQKQLVYASQENLMMLCQVLKDNLREVEDAITADVDADARPLLEVYQLLLTETLELAFTMSRRINSI